MICGSVTSGLGGWVPAAAGREAADEKRVRPRHFGRRGPIVDHQVPHAQVDLVLVGLVLEKSRGFHADLGHFARRLGGQDLFQALVFGR